MTTDPPLYLDWNASTPLAEEVVAAMQQAIAVGWANPASVHGPGRRARSLVEDARDAVAALVGFDRRETVLTGGGTEANNLALELAAAGPAAVVLGRVEHPSVLRPAEHLASRGIEVRWIEADAEGQLPVEAFAEALARPGPPVRLVSLQAVNHETGVIQPVAAVAELAHRAGALLHCDAVQAVGKLAASAWEGADVVSVAAHKLRGPKGIGALLTRPGVIIPSVLRGGSQEKGARPGTQDPVGAAGFAAACERARSSPGRWAEVAPVRDALEAGLLELTGDLGIDLRVNGGAGRRAPHVTNLSFLGWRGPELVAALDLEGIAVSSGSACSAGTPEPSPVVAAMAGWERASSAVRFSLGEDLPPETVDRVISAVRRVLQRTSPIG